MSKSNHFKKYLPVVVGGLLTVILGGAVIYFVAGILEEGPAQTKKVVQQISLIKPPPPPPPPPKQEKPPEPEIEEVKLEEPETPQDIPDDVPDDMPPPGELLGLDADGGAGSDAFGLIGKKGGRSLLGSGSGNELAWYSNKIESYIESTLYDLAADDEELKKIRSSGYVIRIKVWISDSLKLKAKLMGTTGDDAKDQVLGKALSKLGYFDIQTPENMKQPIRLRITSRI